MPARGLYTKRCISMPELCMQQLGSRKDMSYPRYLRYLDTFGLFALLSAVIYAWLPEAKRPEPHLDSLWGNFSTEMLGIWLGVRLIDFIIRAHESSTKARVRTVRFMRFMEGRIHAVLDFEQSHDLKGIYRELDWIKTRMPSRRRHLKADEQRDLDAFFKKLDEILAMLPDKNTVRAQQNTYKLEIQKKGSIQQKILELEALRRTAEDNILEETDEDEGL